MELENLVKLIQTVSDSDLTGFQYEENGVKLKIQKEKERRSPTYANCFHGCSLSTCLLYTSDAADEL